MTTAVFMVFILLFGIVIGSFLNVCIYRIPEKQSIVTGRSHCRSCLRVLKWYELIPVASYLFLGGKCKGCGKRISIQYPLVELFNGLLYVLIVTKCGFFFFFFLYCLFASVLIVISLIDAKTYEIPLGCNVLIAAFGIARLFLHFDRWYEYAGGAVVVSGFFLLAYLVTKGRGIGGGDIKLMAAAGLFLGFGKILVAAGIGSILGAVIHLTLMKLCGKDRVLPFGPYLSAGILISMLWGDGIIRWYLQFCGLA